MMLSSLRLCSAVVVALVVAASHTDACSNEAPSRKYQSCQGTGQCEGNLQCRQKSGVPADVTKYAQCRARDDQDSRWGSVLACIEGTLVLGALESTLEPSGNFQESRTAPAPRRDPAATRPAQDAKPAPKPQAREPYVDRSAVPSVTPYVREAPLPDVASCHAVCSSFRNYSDLEISGRVTLGHVGSGSMGAITLDVTGQEPKKMEARVGSAPCPAPQDVDEWLQGVQEWRLTTFVDFQRQSSGQLRTVRFSNLHDLEGAASVDVYAEGTLLACCNLESCGMTLH